MSERNTTTQNYINNAQKYLDSLKTQLMIKSQQYENVNDLDSTEDKLDEYSILMKNMDLIDLCAILADWKAMLIANDNNSNIFKSIELHQEEIGYSNEIKQILINTLKYFNV